MSAEELFCHRAACPAGLGAAFSAAISASGSSRASEHWGSSRALTKSPCGPRTPLWRRRHSRMAISAPRYQRRLALSCPLHVSATSRPITLALGGARPGRSFVQLAWSGQHASRRLPLPPPLRVWARARVRARACAPRCRHIHPRIRLAPVHSSDLVRASLCGS